MPNRKIIGAACAMTVIGGMPGAAIAQTQKEFYGEPPCGFFEAPRSKEPGPSWHIDFKKWESDECIEARKTHAVVKDPTREGRRKKIKAELVVAKQIVERMELSRSDAQAAHDEVIKGLREADRLYRVQTSRSTGTRNWTAYKNQLGSVEELRGSYRQRNAVYVSVRGEYEKQLASLKLLQTAETAS